MGPSSLHSFSIPPSSTDPALLSSSSFFSQDLDLCIFDPYRPEGFDHKFFRTATNAAEHLPTVRGLPFARVIREAELRWPFI